ncbi:Hpt domain-containing protein [Alteromonas sp. NFXS44]|uniref:Hpt domain-containing protein n=1 Tax=Alteromonas sp. NFXS44 TaxID=2818435 RepID=UPI0032DEA71B
MDSAEKIINLEFGLSQLSGNKTLFLRLLQKFADEYQHASDKLQTLLDNCDWQEARVYIHTIKGVSSNLGINQLHLTCKEAENELKAQESVPASLPALKQTVVVTLDAIATLQANPALLDDLQAAEAAMNAPAAGHQDSEPAVATAGTTVSPASDPQTGQAPAAFIQALEQSEFIAQDQLDSWLAATTQDPALQQTLRDAIDELDYDTALNLIRG